MERSCIDNYIQLRIEFQAKLGTTNLVNLNLLYERCIAAFKITDTEKDKNDIADLMLDIEDYEKRLSDPIYLANLRRKIVGRKQYKGLEDGTLHNVVREHILQSVQESNTLRDAAIKLGISYRGLRLKLASYE